MKSDSCGVCGNLLATGLQYLDLLKQMGFRWIVRRAGYALKQWLGVIERKTPVQDWNQVPAPEIAGIFFPESMPASHTVSHADAIRKGQFTCFFHHKFSPGFPPDWFANPFAESTDPSPALSHNHWSAYPILIMGISSASGN